MTARLWVTLRDANERAGLPISRAAKEVTRRKLHQAEQDAGLDIIRHHRCPGAADLVDWDLAKAYLVKRSEVDDLRSDRWLDVVRELSAAESRRQIDRYHRKVVTPKLKELWDRDEVVAKAVKELAKELGRCAKSGTD